MKFDAVIFDLDGTLLDSIEDLADSVNFVLAQKGYPQRTYEEIKNFVGRGVKHLIADSLPRNVDYKEIEDCLEKFKKHYSNNMDVKTRPYKGIYPMLQELKRRDIKMAIVSNKLDSDVQVLSKIFFEDYIKVTVGDRSHTCRKPAPDSIFEVLKELGAQKEQTLYVGDTEVDIATATNADLVSISVTWGFRTEKELLDNGATYIIHHPKQIFKILDEL